MLFSQSLFGQMRGSQCLNAGENGSWLILISGRSQETTETQFFITKTMKLFGKIHGEHEPK